MTELNNNTDNEVLSDKKFSGLSSFTLHIIAMIFMLCDHMWGTILSDYRILTDIGRIAFPIFAFMIVEGYFHTRDFKKYLKRLFIFAIVSEIPINLMSAGNIIFPFHQNVIWTFIIGLLCIRIIENAKAKNNMFITVVVSILATMLGDILGSLLMVDYYGFGVLTILVFYFFRGRKWYNYVAQFIGLFYINFNMIGGFMIPVNIFGYSFEFSQQGLAVLAMIPICLYNGKQGLHNKYVQYAFYAFYPLHMLILSLMAMYM